MTVQPESQLLILMEQLFRGHNGKHSDMMHTQL